MAGNLFDLEGRVAVVTGASRGIGAAIARLLAERGARVIVTSRKLDGCEVIAKEIREAGNEAEAFACHIGDMAQIEKLYAHIDEHYGQIDILINNAATNPYFGSILDTPLSAFEKTVEVNLRGFFYMSTMAGQRMRTRGKGAIVNVASVNGISPAELQGIYSVTKAAVINMTKAFARECGPLGIRVNALLPGLTETKLAAALYENREVHDYWVERTPLKRIAQPEEMAGAVLYLVSDAASFTTGSTLLVDGGLLI